MTIKYKKMNNKGFSHLLLFTLVIVVLAVIGFVGLRVYGSMKANDEFSKEKTSQNRSEKSIEEILANIKQEVFKLHDNVVDDPDQTEAAFEYQTSSKKYNVFAKNSNTTILFKAMDDDLQLDVLRTLANSVQNDIIKILLAEGFSKVDFKPHFAGTPGKENYKANFLEQSDWVCMVEGEYSITIDCVQKSTFDNVSNEAEPFVRLISDNEKITLTEIVRYRPDIHAGKTSGYQYADVGYSIKNRGGDTLVGGALLFYKKTSSDWVYTGVRSMPIGYSCEKIEAINDLRLAMLGETCADADGNWDSTVK